MHETCSAASRPTSLDVQSDHLEIVRRLLARHVPGLEVWAFGSRVSGRAGKHSDLDLCIRTANPLSFTAMGLMEEAYKAIPQLIPNWTTPLLTLALEALAREVGDE